MSLRLLYLIFVRVAGWLVIGSARPPKGQVSPGAQFWYSTAVVRHCLACVISLVCACGHPVGMAYGGKKVGECTCCRFDKPNKGLPTAFTRDITAGIAIMCMGRSSPPTAASK